MTNIPASMPGPPNELFEGLSLESGTTLDLRFHHVGLACLDLDRETQRLAPLGYRAEGEDFADVLQGVRGRFLVGQTPRLELLIPLGDGCVLTPWLESKVKLYHLAYETCTMSETVKRLCECRARKVVGPVPSRAFQGREIAFLMLPNMLLIELIQV